MLYGIDHGFMLNAASHGDAFVSLLYLKQSKQLGPFVFQMPFQ